MPFLVAVPIENLHTPDLSNRGLLPRSDAPTLRRRRPFGSAHAVRATMAPPTGLSDSSRAHSISGNASHRLWRGPGGPSWPGDRKHASGFVRNLLATSPPCTRCSERFRRPRLALSDCSAQRPMRAQASAPHGRVAPPCCSAAKVLGFCGTGHTFPPRTLRRVRPIVGRHESELSRTATGGEPEPQARGRP